MNVDLTGLSLEALNDIVDRAEEAIDSIEAEVEKAKRPEWIPKIGEWVYGLYSKKLYMVERIQDGGGHNVLLNCDGLGFCQLENFRPATHEEMFRVGAKVKFSYRYGDKMLEKTGTVFFANSHDVILYGDGHMRLNLEWLTLLKLAPQ